MDMPPWLDRLGGFIERTSGFWRRLGNLETSAHAEALEAIAIDRPIYVAGLARSGSTILLEMLASHGDAATHQYRDFPPVFTPIFWNKAFGHVLGKDVPAVERAHKDRILVTPSSPEAMEEVLWMSFFADCHDPSRSQVLDGSTSRPDFERFYTDHIKKILLIRGGRRYLSKGNYNVARLAYLLKILPDARLIVPVRRPEAHIASLAKQHRLFCEAERRDPRILRHMRRMGHFEFGLDRRPIHAGNDATTRSILELWQKGEELRGWARLWASVYGLILDKAEADANLRRHLLLVRYEDLCEHPSDTLAAVHTHTGLPITADRLAELAAQASYPAYYASGFSDEDRLVIEEETAEVVARIYG